MTAFLQIVRLQLRAVVRSRTLPMLVAATLAWTAWLPYLIRGDGTAAGEFQLYVYYSLGGACLLATVSLAAAAAGSLAADRAARRLQLTAVRPVPLALVALGRSVALTAVGAGVMALAAVSATVRLAWYPKTFATAEGQAQPLGFSLSRPCYRVLAPILEKTARQEAEEAYERFRVNPATSNNVAGVDRAVALEILTRRAEERFDLVDAGASVEWKFAPVPDRAERLAVRMKFSNRLESWGDFSGIFSIGGCSAAVSNVTQAVLIAPLPRPQGAAVSGALRFDNTSKEGVMLRPRKDIHLLYGLPGDVFAVNLCMACLASTAMISLVVSFALFLGACLGRSVSVFTVVVLLLVAEIAPSIVDEFTEEQAASLGDRIGMRITEMVVHATEPVGGAHPIESLANDECVEPGETARTLAIHLVAMPLLFALLSGLVIPRKQD